MTSIAQQVGGYLLGEAVAQTGLTAVYRAVPAAGGARVALKVFHSYFGTEPGLPDAFLRGMAAVKTLRHPNILPVLDAGNDGPTLWAALAWCDGITLRQTIHPPYPLPIAAALTAALAAALTAAHAQNIFHRNLKPNNVWVQHDGTVLLSDFGMAVLGEQASPLMRSQLHTPLPAFMSPEHADGVAVDAVSDTYALGALLYWMLTGRPPFGGDTNSAVFQQQTSTPPRSPSHLNPELTRDVDAVVLRALSPYPIARTQSPAALADQLTTLARPASTGELAAYFDSDLARRAAAVTHHQAWDTQGVRAVPPISPYEVNFAAKQHDIPGSQAVDPDRIERTFGRVWAPSKINKRKELARAAAITAVVVALAGWWARPYFVPPERLPAPSTAVTTATAPGTWPMGRHDVGRTGAAPALPVAFKGELQWKYPTGPEPVLSSPVYDGATVYLATGNRRLLALNATDGVVRWERPASGPVDSVPALANGVLYYGQRDGNVFAINTSDGSLLWQVQTGGPVLSSPVVADGAVFVGSGDGNVYAFDAVTGAERWTYKTGGWVTSSPAYANGTVIVGSRDGWLTYLDANNGAFLFHFFTIGGVEGGAAVASDAVYVGADSRRFWGLDLAARSERFDRPISVVHAQLYLWGLAAPPPPPRGLRWSVRSPGRFGGMPAVGLHTVYAATANAALKAPPEGALVPPYQNTEMGSNIVWDGVLHAWDRATGTPKWTFATLGAQHTSPVLVGDTLYVGSDDRRLYALDAATGAVQWSFQADDMVRSTPAVTKEGIFFGAHDGTLYALR